MTKKPGWILMAVLVGSLLTNPTVFAEPEAEPYTNAQIMNIENRGHEIADYDRVATVATDVLLGMKPNPEQLGLYVAEKVNDVWMVSFGKYSDFNGFMPTYIFSCPSDKPNEMKLLTYEEVEKILDDYPSEVPEFTAAIDTAVEATKPDMTFPTYNPSVFRELDQTITVYLLPGNDDTQTILLGGDFKIKLTSNGKKVINKEKLHASYIRFPVERPKDAVMSLHTHPLSDLPNETDIAMILLHPVLAPHAIVGNWYTSTIDKDGKIQVKKEEQSRNSRISKQHKDDPGKDIR